VDFYGVGKLNHNAELEKTIDWQLFRTDVETNLTGYGKDYKIKAALKVATPNFGKKRAELTETAGDASGSEHIEEAEARSLVAEEQFHEDAKASSPVSPESSFFKLMQKLLAELKADHEDKELDPLCKNRALSKDEYLDKLIQCRNENPADFKTTVNLLAEDSGLTATDIRKQINARVKESKSEKGSKHH